MLNSFKEFQEEYTKWLNRNFPNSTPGDQLLGVTEEIGELCHSVLKAKQGIRGTKEEHEEAAKDAVGDLLIFLTGFCVLRGWNMQEILDNTWESVKTT